MSFMTDILERIKFIKTEVLPLCNTQEERAYQWGQLEAYQCLLRTLDKHFNTGENECAVRSREDELE